MKKVLTAFAALTITVVAQTGSFKSEYERLLKEYETAAKQALDPVQRRHATALQLLIRKATQAGDLETAVKAKEALDQIVPPPVSRNATTGASKRAALTASLTASKWSVFDTPTQQRIDIQSFNPDGTCAGRFNGKWEISSGDTIRIYANNQTYSGTVNEAGTQIDFPRINRTLRKE